jgi:hypothetical protein
MRRVRPCNAALQTSGLSATRSEPKTHGATEKQAESDWAVICFRERRCGQRKISAGINPF